MKFLSRLILGRPSKVGLLSDAAMVSSAALRVARRGPAGPTKRANPIQWMLVAAAAVRILGRVRRVRARRVRARRAGSKS